MDRTAIALVSSFFLSATAFAETAPPPGGKSAATATADAERLGKEGERLLSAHDAAGAVDQLGKAYNLSHNPKFLMSLGLAYAEADRPLDALEALGKFLKDSPSIPDAKRREIGTKLGVMIDQVSAVVTVEATRQNAAVKLDGRPIGLTPIETPLRLMPGRHELVMQPAATDPSSGARVPFEVKPGERKAVKLEPQARSRFIEPQAQNDPGYGQGPDDPAVRTPGTDPTGATATTPRPTSEGQPLYKKWWLWTAVGGAVAIVAIGVGAGVGARSSSSSTSSALTSEEYPNVPSWSGGLIDARSVALVRLGGLPL